MLPFYLVDFDVCGGFLGQRYVLMLRRGSLGAFGYNSLLDRHDVVNRMHVTTVGGCRGADISDVLRRGSRYGIVWVQAEFFWFLRVPFIYSLGKSDMEVLVFEFAYIHKIIPKPYCQEIFE